MIERNSRPFTDCSNCIRCDRNSGGEREWALYYFRQYIKNGNCLTPRCLNESFAIETEFLQYLFNSCVESYPHFKLLTNMQSVTNDLKSRAYTLSYYWLFMALHCRCTPGKSHHFSINVEMSKQLTQETAKQR